jgi:hypothetical protein
MSLRADALLLRRSEAISLEHQKVRLLRRLSEMSFSQSTGSLQ